METMNEQEQQVFLHILGMDNAVSGMMRTLLYGNIRDLDLHTERPLFIAFFVSIILIGEETNVDIVLKIMLVSRRRYARLEIICLFVIRTD